MSAYVPSDTGELLGFDVKYNGDVTLAFSDIEDNYARYVTIKYQYLQGIAEASHNNHATIKRPGP